MFNDGLIIWFPPEDETLSHNIPTVIKMSDLWRSYKKFFVNKWTTIINVGSCGHV